MGHRLMRGAILGGLCIVFQGCAMNREYTVRQDPANSNAIEMRQSRRASLFPITKDAIWNVIGDGKDAGVGGKAIIYALVAPISVPFDLVFGWFKGRERLAIAMRVKIIDENRNPIPNFDFHEDGASVNTDANGEFALSVRREDTKIDAVSVSLDFGSNWASELNTTGEAVRPTPEKVTYTFNPKNSAEPIELRDQRGDRLPPIASITLKIEALEDKAVKLRVRQAAEKALIERIGRLVEQMKTAKTAAARGKSGPDMGSLLQEIEDMRSTYQQRNGVGAFRNLLKKNGLEVAFEVLGQ